MEVEVQEAEEDEFDEMAQQYRGAHQGMAETFNEVGSNDEPRK